jgi:hypothetical protein
MPQGCAVHSKCTGLHNFGPFVKLGFGIDTAPVSAVVAASWAVPATMAQRHERLLIVQLHLTTRCRLSPTRTTAAVDIHHHGCLH